MPTLAAVLTALLVVLVPVAPARAQDQPTTTSEVAAGPDTPTLSWAIEPSGETGPTGRAAFEYAVGPGTRITDVVRVSNPGDRPVTLDVYASDAFTADGGGFDLLPAADEPVDVGAWVTVEGTPVSLEPGAHADLPFSIAVPANASPGDHVGGIVASLARAQTGDLVEVDQRVGSRIYLRVDGPARPALTITDLAVDHRGSANPAGGTVTVRWAIENTGNLRLAGRPTLRLVGPFGVTLERRELDALPELLPGSALTGEATVDGVWSLGRVTAELEVRPVLTDATAPVGARSVTASASTGAWSPTLVALVTVVVAVIAFRVDRRRRRHRGAASPGPGRHARAGSTDDDGEPAGAEAS